MEKKGPKEWNDTLDTWCYKLPLRREEEKLLQEKVGERVAQVQLRPRKRKGEAVAEVDVSDDDQPKKKLTKEEKQAQRAEQKASAELTRRRQKDQKESFRLATAALPKLRAVLKDLRAGLLKLDQEKQPLLVASLTQQVERPDAWREEACKYVVENPPETNLSFGKEQLEKEVFASEGLLQTLVQQVKPKRRVRGKKADEQDNNEEPEGKEGADAGTEDTQSPDTAQTAAAEAQG